MVKNKPGNLVKCTVEMDDSVYRYERRRGYWLQISFNVLLDAIKLHSFFPILHQIWRLLSMNNLYNEVHILHVQTLVSTPIIQLEQ